MRPGAADARRLGFDAIELHGAHGHLLDQPFWKGANQRSDNYGGSIEKRTQFAVDFAVDIVSAVRARVGFDMPSPPGAITAGIGAVSCAAR